MNIYKFGNKKWFFLTFVSSILISFKAVFTAYIVGEFINIATIGNFNDLKKNIVISFIGVFIIYLFNLFYIYSKNELLLSCNMNMKSIVFDKLLSQENNQIKENISLMTNDLKQLETKVFINEITILQNIFLFLSALFFCLYIDPLTSVFFFISASTPLLLSNLFSNKIKKKSEKWSQYNGHYLGKLTDYMSGIDTVVNYNAQKVIKSDFDKTSENLEKSLKDMNNIVDIGSQTVLSFASILMYGLAFGFGIFRTISGSILIGQFMSILQSSNYLVDPLLIISKLINEKKTASKILEVVKDINEEKHSSDNTDDFKISTLEIINGELSYGTKVLFSNLNLVINKGEKVLISAPSGYGKSSLLKILGGFSKLSSGKYLINGIDTEKKNLKTSFSMIRQDPFIFDNTILFNITMGNDYNMEKVNAAIYHSQMTDFINDKGIYYQVGENGKNLSGGQLQRIEIARGLLADREIILADEITSSLDIETSDYIFQYLLNSDKTFIEVSHKVSEQQLSLYDKIIYLDK